MAAPTFVASYTTVYTTTNQPKTVSVTTLAGDVVVVCAAMENGGDTYSTISGNGISWNQRQLSIISASFSQVSIWTGTDSSGGTNWTLSVGTTNGTLSRFGITCYVFRGSDGIGGSNVTNAATSAPSLNVTTLQDNSAVVVINDDWNALSGSGRTWRTVNSVTPTAGNNLERLYYDGSAAVTHTVYSAYYDDVGTAGSKTVGLSAPSGQTYSIAAVEVKGTAGGSTAMPLMWIGM